ncbi:MAG TPA: hypothetical protein VFA44_13350 [Gaiellaceae bacterium]|nr:hypothetical protein [Gaiellaceae bacterium]
MKRLRTRTVIAGTVALIAAAGAVGGALAASGTFDPAKERQAYLDDAAQRLGVSSAKLEDALKQAALDRVDAALAAGQITQDEAQAMKDAINAGRLGVPGVGFGFGMHGLGGMHVRGALGLDAAAGYLGLSEAELRSELGSGKSLADIAKAQGKSVDGLEQALLAAAKTKLDQAVADGRITSAQRDQIMADLKSRVADLVNRTLPLGPWGHEGRMLGPAYVPGGFGRPSPAGAPTVGMPTA